MYSPSLSKDPIGWDSISGIVEIGSDTLFSLLAGMEGSFPFFFKTDKAYRGAIASSPIIELLFLPTVKTQDFLYYRAIICTQLV